MIYINYTPHAVKRPKILFSMPKSGCFPLIMQPGTHGKSHWDRQCSSGLTIGFCNLSLFGLIFIENEHFSGDF